ncbi:MAG: flavin-containing monooxygenase [Alteromonas sp.]
MQHEKQFTALIIGSGFGGQCAAVELKKMDISDYVILERRNFIGGTWAQNSYPGAAVDVHSPLYSLSFEPYDWSRLFAEQQELENYTRHVFEKYELTDKTITGANVTQVKWLEDESLWQVTVNDSTIYKCQFLINASGPLSTPIIPKLEGQDKFKGNTFHTNNWDHNVDLTGKRVAIMGSGASAAQVIPAIVEKVKELHVFQRTPHWLLSRWDIVFKPWQRWLLRKKPFYYALRWLIYWLLEVRILGFKYSRTLLHLLGTIPAKRQLKQQIKDPDLRAKLTPDFTIGCKRIIVSSTLLPALAHANTSLHDKHDAIQELTETGIVTDQGSEIPIDVLVYSTGYDAADGIISFSVIGRNRKVLSEAWCDYPRAYLGTCVPDFPNLFIVTGPNTGIGHTSALFVIESQMRYIAHSINAVRQRNVAYVEVKTQAEEDYTQRIHNEMQHTVWQSGGCNSWYKSKSGKVTAMFPGFSFSYRRLCNKFRPDHHTFGE